MTEKTTPQLITDWINGHRNDTIMYLLTHNPVVTAAFFRAATKCLSEYDFETVYNMLRNKQEEIDGGW